MRPTWIVQLKKKDRDKLSDDMKKWLDAPDMINKKCYYKKRKNYNWKKTKSTHTKHNQFKTSSHAFKIKRKDINYNRSRLYKHVLLNAYPDIIDDIYHRQYNGHHVDYTYVIYIPDNMHRIHKHTQINNDSMMRINLYAWDYLESSSY